MGVPMETSREGRRKKSREQEGQQQMETCTQIQAPGVWRGDLGCRGPSNCAVLYLA